MQQRNARTGLGRSLAAATTVVAVFALSNAPTPLYPHWQVAWGFGSGTLTVVFAAYIVGLIGALLFAGRIADRHGRRVVLLPGLGLAVASSALFLLAQDVAWLLVARLLAGIAVGAVVTAGMAAVVDLAPAARRHTGSLLASAAMVLGAGLGPLLTGVIARATDSPQIAVFSALTATSLVGLIIAWTLPLSRPTHRDTSPWRLPMPPTAQRRELLWGIAAFGPGITATSFVLSLGPSVLSHRLGVTDPLLVGVTACGMFLAATCVQFALARLATRGHLLLSSLAAIAAMVLLAMSMSGLGGPTMFVAAALFAGVAQGLGQLAGLTLIATHIPTHRRAESNAVLSIGGYVPAALLPIATGYLADATGLAVAVTAFASALAMTAAVAMVAVRVSTRDQSSHRQAETKSEVLS